MDGFEPENEEDDAAASAYERSEFQFHKGLLISSSISNILIATGDVAAGHNGAAAGNDGVPVCMTLVKLYRLSEEYFRRATRIIEVNRRVVSGVLTIIFIMQFYRIFGAL